MKPALIIPALILKVAALGAGPDSAPAGPGPSPSPSGVPRPPAVLAPTGKKADGLTDEISALLHKVGAVYHDAKSYRDHGRAVVVQQTGRMKVTTEAPMELTFARPNRLHLDGGQYEALCDGMNLLFIVPSARQFTSVRAPDALERRHLPTGSVLGGTDEGHPELIDFLTHADAMDTLLSRVTKIGWLPDSTVASSPCRVLAYETNGGTKMTLSIDAARFVLLKAEGQSVPGANPEIPAEQQIHLTYDFAPVEINPALDATAFPAKPPAGFQHVREIGGDPVAADSASKKVPEAYHLLGQPLPPIAGTDLTGQALAEGALKGKTVLLFFWGATGSEHSLTSIALIQALADRYKDRTDFAVLGINTDAEPRPLAGQLLDRKKATFRCLTDEARAFRLAFQLAGVPTFILADRNGIMRWATLGAPPTLKNDLDAQVEKVLSGRN